MPSFIEKRNAAGDRYAAAVQEFQAARVDLCALDQLCRAPSFGLPPEIVPFRHPTFAPNYSGSFTDGVGAAREKHSKASA
jgi:hypothetical protein